MQLELDQVVVQMRVLRLLEDPVQLLLGALAHRLLFDKDELLQILELVVEEGVLFLLEVILHVVEVLEKEGEDLALVGLALHRKAPSHLGRELHPLFKVLVKFLGILVMFIDVSGDVLNAEVVRLVDRYVGRVVEFG